jgi:flagellar biosynthetic protein FliR
MNAADASGGIEAAVVTFTLVLARVSALVFTFPLFGQRYLPRLVKVGLCLSLSAAWYSPEIIAEYAFVVVSNDWVRYAGWVFREVLVGAFLGYGFGVLLLPMRVAGTYVGQEMGYNLGGITDPGSQSASNETGVLFESWGILMLLMMDLHHVLLTTLHESFSALHPGEGFADSAFRLYARLLSDAHDVGLLIVAPLAVLLFAALVVLSVLMRAWPQINLFSFGIGARLTVGFLLWLALLPRILANLQNFLRSAAEILPLYLLGV